jgi:hypothetical protein
MGLSLQLPSSNASYVPGYADGTTKVSLEIVMVDFLIPVLL